MKREATGVEQKDTTDVADLKSRPTRISSTDGRTQKGLCFKGSSPLKLKLGESELTIMQDCNSYPTYYQISALCSYCQELRV